MNCPDLAKLKGIISEKKECFIVKETKLHLKIWPQYTHDLKAGIIACLDKMMGCFHKSLDGLLIGYENLKLYQNEMRVNSYIHLVVKATFYVFAPTVGIIVEGIVKNTTAETILFLILDKFNIVFKKKMLYKYLEKTGHLEKASQINSIHATLSEGSTTKIRLAMVLLPGILPDLHGYPVDDSSVNQFCKSPSISSESSESKKKVTFKTEPEERAYDDDNDVKLNGTEEIEINKIKKEKKAKKKTKSLKTNGVHKEESEELPKKKKRKFEESELDESISSDNSSKKPAKRRKIKQEI